MPADYDQDAEIWPENWLAFNTFIKFDTQWRVGMSGPTALDYGPLFTYMDRLDLARDEWDQLFDDIRVIEAAALKAMRSK